MEFMAWFGVGLAGLAACCNAGIDILRKHGSASVPPGELVCLVLLFEVVVACSVVSALGSFDLSGIKRPLAFWSALVGSSLLLFLTKFLYQRAVELSPLSLTIPYLSFTPAILVATAYVFIGEVPTISGLVGVIIVTVGGYLLSLHSVQQSGKEDEETAHSASEGLKAGRTDKEVKFAKADAKLSKPRSPFPSTVGDGPLWCWAYLLQRWAALIERRNAWRKEPGTLLMLVVAGLWSITASLDKIGVTNAPSIGVYIALQRMIMASAALCWLLVFAPGAFLRYGRKFVLLLGISLLELSSVMFFMRSLEYILVSYVVAIKRCGILFSVIAGRIFFQEDIAGRLPYILVMVLGMLMIVLEPTLGQHVRRIR